MADETTNNDAPVDAPAAVEAAADTAGPAAGAVAEGGAATAPAATTAAPSGLTGGGQGGYSSGPREGGFGARRGPGGGKRFPRRKVCAFCVDKVDYIDYKDVKRTRKFMSDRGKILPRRITGNCAAHQRMVTVALKRARVIALVPFKMD